jgi:hypothetical protein
MRTVLDQWWQPPGTPLSERRIEQHISTLTNQMWAEAALDRKKWGLTWHQPRPRSAEQALPIGIRELIDRFIEPRRTHFYVNHSITNTTRPLGVTHRHNVGIPEAQAPDVLLQFGTADRSPDAPNQAYLSLTNGNPAAVDLSGWRLQGGARVILPSGTVLPPHGVLYLSPDVRAFRGRQLAPRRGQGLFVLGNYKGDQNDPIALEDNRGRRLAISSR